MKLVTVAVFGILALSPSLAYAACSATYPVGNAADSVVSFLASGTNLPFVGPTTFQSVEAGTLTYDSGTNTLQLCNGTAWMAIATSSSAGSSGTAGYLKISAGSGAFTSDSTTDGQLFWDTTNHRLGIGTTSPTNMLSLGGDAARTVWMERHTTANTAGNNLTVQSGGATSAATDKNGGDLVLSSGTATGTGSSNITFKAAPAGTTGTTDRSPATAMTILGNGNIGIGTTNPTRPIDVFKLGASLFYVDSNGYLVVSNPSNGSFAQLNNGGLIFTSNNPELSSSYSGGALIQKTNSGSGRVERVRVDSSGNVGIGTTSPTNLLSLGGDAARTIWMERSATAAATGNSLTLQAGGTKSGNTDQNGGDLIVSSGTATGTGSSNITFKTAPAGTTGTTDRAPATAMTVTGAGDVGIGTTTPNQLGFGAGNTILNVNGSAASIIAASYAGSNKGFMSANASNFYIQSYLADSGEGGQ